nr:type II toxin-antitoxin system HicB family antitoxin [Methanolacinia paynteri]
MPRRKVRAHIHIIQSRSKRPVPREACPSLPGCRSQGKTRAEALENIKDAAKGYLESLKKHNEPIPLSIYEETVEISA